MTLHGAVEPWEKAAEPAAPSPTANTAAINAADLRADFTAPDCTRIETSPPRPGIKTSAACPDVQLQSVFRRRLAAPGASLFGQVFLDLPHTKTALAKTARHPLT
jgi:hypothetical protein